VEVLGVQAGADDWEVRVVTSLYAVVSADAASEGPGTLPFTGAHEVVVESSRHDWDLRFGSPDEIATVLFAIRQRCKALSARGPAATIVFRNYGQRAGASLSHPHSQIVSLDQAPPRLVDRWRRAREHFEQTGRCLHDDLAEAERRDGTRVVSDADGVLVVQPYAASVPHQTLLLPDDRSPDLTDASDDALIALAETLPRVLAG